MDVRESLNPSFNCSFETGGRVGLRETHRRLHGCQQVLGPVLGFASQDRDLRVGPLALGNVAGDFRRADNFAFRILYGRDRQRNVNPAPLLALANSLMLLDPLAAPHTFKDRRLLIAPVQRNQGGDGPADDLLARIAKYPFRALVPACDDAIEVLAYDCIITRLDIRTELSVL